MDDAGIMIVGKLLLTFGVMLGLPLWELYRLRREMERRQRTADTAPDQAASSAASGS